MKKFFLKPLYITFIIFLFTLLGIISDVATVFNYNFYNELIKPNSPHSYVYLIFLHVCIFLILVVISFIKNIKNSEEKISESDLEILDGLGEVFSSDTFYEFKEFLEQSRAVFISQLELFENTARRYLEGDKILSNKALEREKNYFLHSLLNFNNFAEAKFNPISNPNIVKFLGGTSKFESIKAGTYEKEEQEYLSIAKEMYASWISFQKKIKKVYPNNYVWKK